MTNLERFRNSIRLLRQVYNFIGQDIFSAPVIRRSGMFYVFLALTLTMIVFNALNLLFTDDLPKSTRVAQIALICAVIQVTCKCMYLADFIKLRRIIDYFDTFYQENSRQNDKYFVIGRRYSRLTNIGLKSLFTILIVVILIVLVLSMYDSYQTGAPALFFYFPFVHEYTTWQLMALNLHAAVTNLIGAVVEPAGDALIFVIVVNLMMIPAIVEVQMDELSTRLEQRLVTAAEIKRRWLHYIAIHQNFNEHLRLMDDCFYYYFIIQFLMSMAFSTLEISAFSKEATFCGGIAAMGILHLGGYCMLGTSVEHSSNGIYDAVFKLKWYLLPLNEQRIYHLLLLHCQQPKVIYIANVKPLNMNTYLQILKAIFTYGMVFGAMM